MMWIGYARAGKEFEVEQAIKDLGVDVWCARKVEYKRIAQSKDRRPQKVISPYLRNYVFIDCAPDLYLDVVGVKHLASTMQAVGVVEARIVRRWLDARAAEYDERTAQIEADERELERQEGDRQAKLEAAKRLSEYQEGEALEILRGPLAGLFATFRRIVERDHEMFPRAEVEAEMLGGKRKASVDILDVRKVG